jgi:hypothetical protein
MSFLKPSDWILFAALVAISFFIVLGLVRWRHVVVGGASLSNPKRSYLAIFLFITAGLMSATSIYGLIVRHASTGGAPTFEQFSELMSRSIGLAVCLWAVVSVYSSKQLIPSPLRLALCLSTTGLVCWLLLLLFS